MVKIILTLFCLTAFNVNANELFAKADVAAGKALHDKNCVSCHASSFGGDGSAMYTRDFAKVTDAKKLIAQVRNCNTNIGLKWFDDEELNVAAFLNKMYYKFD
jgi:mono/diheme cytochrome c family protein